MEKRENDRCALCGEGKAEEGFCCICDHMIRHMKKLNTFVPGTVNVPDYEVTFECGASKMSLTEEDLYIHRECLSFRRKPKITLICRRLEDDPKRLKELPIYGDCLKRIGIPSEGRAVFDLSRSIREGDVVHCSKYAGSINTYVKQVRRIEGDLIIVGTCYEDPEKDFEFEAEEIIGVCIKVMDKANNVVWRAAEVAKKKIDENLIIIQSDDDFFGAVLNCAVRYALGRQSYMPGLVVDWITPQLPKLTDKTLWCFEKDVSEADRNDALGHPNIDAVKWRQFLTAVQAERARRKADEK